ncbi:MAG: hypothetical protein QXI22_07710, partial [Sulfolobales archaeon]
EILVLTYGGIYGTLQTAVDLLRSEGLRVGALRLRLWRPFPARDLKTLVEDAKTLIVVDRAISYGASIEGPVALETIAALYREGLYPAIASFIAGIGGRPVSEDDFRGMVKKALELGERALKIGSIHWGVRGVEYE